MTRFQQFLMERRIAEYVEYLNTLSESEAQEILSQLDEQTFEIIASIVNEGFKETLKKYALPVVAGAGLMLGAQKIMDKPSDTTTITQRTHTDGRLDFGKLNKEIQKTIKDRQDMTKRLYNNR